MGAREAIADLEFAGRRDARVLLKDSSVGLDPETAAFEGEVVAGLPDGDDLTGAELRVDYLLEKLAAEHERIIGVEAFTKRRVEMVLAHKATELAKLAKRVEWLESKIREHMPLDSVGFKKQYGAKSHRLPHGQIGYRSSRATVDIVDPVRALEFAKARGLEISVTERVNKTPLLDYVRETGDYPDDAGFTVVEPSDEFFVSPDLEF